MTTNASSKPSLSELEELYRSGGTMPPGRPSVAWLSRRSEIDAERVSALKAALMAAAELNDAANTAAAVAARAADAAAAEASRLAAANAAAQELARAEMQKDIWAAENQAEADRVAKAAAAEADRAAEAAGRAAVERAARAEAAGRADAEQAARAAAAEAARAAEEAAAQADAAGTFLTFGMALQKAAEKAKQLLLVKQNLDARIAAYKRKRDEVLAALAALAAWEPPVAVAVAGLSDPVAPAGAKKGAVSESYLLTHTNVMADSPFLGEAAFASAAETAAGCGAGAEAFGDESDDAVDEETSSDEDYQPSAARCGAGAEPFGDESDDAVDEETSSDEDYQLSSDDEPVGKRQQRSALPFHSPPTKPPGGLKRSRTVWTSATPPNQPSPESAATARPWSTTPPPPKTLAPGNDEVMFLGAHLPLEERFNISKSALEDLASLQRKRKLQAPPYQIVLELPPELSAQRKAITQARSMLFVELAKSHPLSQEALLFARDGPGPDGALQRTLQLVEPFLLEAGHVAGCGGWGLCTLANVTVARGRVLAIYWCVHAARSVLPTLT